jgi:hypothetical protein
MAASGPRQVPQQCTCADGDDWQLCDLRLGLGGRGVHQALDLILNLDHCGEPVNQGARIALV